MARVRVRRGLALTLTLTLMMQVNGSFVTLPSLCVASCPAGQAPNADLTLALTLWPQP